MRKRLAILGVAAIANLSASSPACALTLSASGPIAAIDGPVPAEVRVGTIAEMTVTMGSGAPIRAESSNCEGQRSIGSPPPPGPRGSHRKPRMELRREVRMDRKRCGVWLLPWRWGRRLVLVLG